MRNHQVNIAVIILLSVWSCKVSKPIADKVFYEEDLSIHRAIHLAELEVPSNEVQKQGITRLDGGIDQQMDSVMKLFIQRNEARKTWDGFTIQIYRGNSRTDAELAMQTFKELYPENEVSLVYFQPSYRVKSGSYFNKLEAAAFFEQVVKHFPLALMIPEKLTLPAYVPVD